jgi:hypothetical protein
MQAGLEFPDGSKANIQQGAWLHHTVAVQTAGADPVCAIPGVKLPPGLGEVNNVTGNSPIGFRRLFASGNERTLTRVNTAGKYGIKMGKGSYIGFAIELMNAANKDLNVYFTMRYEYVEKEHTEGYKEITPVWMDITGCGVSSAPAQKGVYQYTSPVWTVDRNGILVGAGGHEHDGGTDTRLFKNGKEICISKQLYGHRRSGFLPMPKDLVMKGMEGASNAPDAHISDAGLCQNLGPVKIGDKLQMTANYDGTLHTQMVRNGRLDPIMGIMVLYIGAL